MSTASIGRDTEHRVPRLLQTQGWRDDRFWSRVDKTGECWVWTGGRTGAGYGNVMRFIDGKRTWFPAHRYALLLLGVRLGTKHVDHRCFNRACVNPEHLRLVTNKQNQENRQGAMANSKTGVRGVCWSNGHQRWVAQVSHNKRRYFKTFTDFDEACAYVLELRNRLFTHNDLDRRVAS